MQLQRLESSLEAMERQRRQEELERELHKCNQLESAERIEQFYRRQLAQKDQVIERQRSILKVLSRPAGSADWQAPSG